MPDSITATKLGAGEINSYLTELENAVSSSDQTLADQDGDSEVTNQLAMAQAIFAAGGAMTRLDTGTVNAYILTVESPMVAPPAYFNGFLVGFKPGNDNTGASTVNVDTLGVKDITDTSGNALVGGEIAGAVYLGYNETDDRFELVLGGAGTTASEIVFDDSDVQFTADNVQNGIEQARFKKNRIINGNFDIWQRGTSQTSNDYDSDDRWFNGNEGSTKVASQQTFTVGQTDVTGNPKYYSRTVVTSVAGAGNNVIKYQEIEYVETLSGTEVTFSFWAKADSAKDIAIEFSQYFGSSGSPSSSVSGIGSQKVTLSTSWQKFELSVDIPSISGKTLGTDGNDFLQARFWFDAGSTYDSRTDTLGQQSGTFDISQVQLEAGGSATDFENRTVGEELLLCQRYYTYGIGLNQMNMSAAFSCAAVVYFPVELREAPTVAVANIANVNMSSTLDISVVTTKSINIGADTAGAGNARIYMSYTADAELFMI